MMNNENSLANSVLGFVGKGILGSFRGFFFISWSNLLKKEEEDELYVKIQTANFVTHFFFINDTPSASVFFFFFPKYIVRRKWIANRT